MSTFLGACSPGANAPRSVAHVEPAASAASAASARAAPTPAPSGEAVAALRASPLLDEGSPAQSIALPGAPPLTLRPQGTALIEVSVGEPSAPTWKTIEVERRAPSLDVPQIDTFERAPSRGLVDREPRRRLHAAKPGEQYAYRARSGGAWSPEIVVRMPTPGGPPPAPASVTARATTPFAVRVAWEADARSAAGFEIAVESKGTFARVALVDPTGRAFVHHHRLPGHAYAYRVRAFNARGASAPSALAAVTTPERAEPSASAKPPPCKRLPPAVDPAKVNGMGRDVLNATSSRPLYNDPEGTNGLRRHLYGEYEGCLRELGAFSLQAEISEVPGFSDEGFPLLYAIAGAGQYVGAEVLTLRFAGGRYAVADAAHFCGDPWPDPDPKDPAVGAEGSGDDLTTYAPPFEVCQRE